jgi:outer membrane protein
MSKSGLINIGLAAAVAVLYVLHFSSGKPSKCPVQDAQGQGGAEIFLSADTSAAMAAASGLSIAFVNVDTLLMNYTLYNSLKNEHETSYKASESKFQAQAEKLQRDMIDYQQKAQKGLLTRNEMQVTEEGLNARQQQLMQLEEKLTRDLMAQEEAMQKRIYDSVTAAIQVINSDKKYKLVLNNAFGSNILDADQGLNITAQVSKILEERVAAK